LELTLLQDLADMSRGAWRDLFCGVHETITGTLDAPLDFFDDLATRTERWFRRLRRPADSKPQPRVQIPVEDVDPTPFVDAWRAMKSDPERQTTRTVHDWAGRAYVFHPAVSGTHTVQVLLGQDGRPNRLAALIEVTSDDSQVIASPDLRLELKVGDAVCPFTHCHAGPVFGGIGVNNRTYLLGAMSSMLVLIEVTCSRARTVWAGFAEDLEKIPLEVALADDPPVPTSDDRDPVQGSARDAPQHADLEAELAAARRVLAEERARGAAAQQRADEAAAALASSECERVALQQRLKADLAEARRALAQERTDRAAAQRRAHEAAIALALSQHERQAVQAQLEAERSARTEGERLAGASVTELVRVMLLMGAANASTHDESLKDKPPGTELPAGEVLPREDTTANAADEAPQAQVEVITASALQVSDVPANQLDDPKSADLHEVEVVHPTSPVATIEVESAALAQEEARVLGVMIDAALEVRLEAAVSPGFDTDPASVADGAEARGLVPPAPEQAEPIGAEARQHVDETSENTREVEVPLDAVPGFDLGAVPPRRHQATTSAQPWPSTQRTMRTARRIPVPRRPRPFQRLSVSTTSRRTLPHRPIESSCWRGRTGGSSPT
jgi:hypothetical protein